MTYMVVPNRYPDIIQPLLASLQEFEPDTRVVIVAHMHRESYSHNLIEYGDGHFVFSRAINLGLSFEPQEDVILLNDDCVLLSPIRATLDTIGLYQKTFGIISPLIKGCAGNPVQRWHEKSRHFVKRSENLIYVHGLTPVCFPCVWLRRDMIVRIGKLSERFIGYGGEDNEYCVRARRKGWFTVVTSELVVQHGNGGTKLATGWGETWSLSFARQSHQKPPRIVPGAF